MRKDAVFGVAVLEYAPGIEIEVVFRFRNQRPWVSWIGYSGRRGLLDGLPTVTPAHLLASLVEGDRLATPSGEEAAALDAESKSSGVNYAYAWMKVCVDAEGEIVEHIRRLKFEPYAIDGKAVVACTAVTFIYSQR